MQNIKEMDSIIDVKKTTTPKLELRLTDIMNHPGISCDYILRKGDHLTIPRRTDEVWVNGEVLNPGGLVWENERGVKYYIKNSGGLITNVRQSPFFLFYHLLLSNSQSITFTF